MLVNILQVKLLTTKNNIFCTFKKLANDFIDYWHRVLAWLNTNLHASLTHSSLTHDLFIFVNEKTFQFKIISILKIFNYFLFSVE